MSASFGLVVLALSLMAAPAMAADPPSSEMYVPDRVVEIDFDVPEESFETLEEEPKEDYVPATMTLRVGGETYTRDEIGLRLKGHGSFQPINGGKAAFKVKLDEFVDDQTLFGLEKMTLNNMTQDSSMQHETLAYETFRELGVASSRTGYAYVRIKRGEEVAYEDYGLYLNIETLDENFQPRWFSSSQHLYEAENIGLDVDPGEAERYEVDEGDEDDFSDLEALIDAANKDSGDWSHNVAGVADLDQMTRMWAVEHYVGQWDGYSLRPANNYYLHSDDSGRFSMIPWGTDQSWGTDPHSGGRSSFDARPALLFRECLDDESCKAQYRDALLDLQGELDDLDLDDRVDELADVLEPWVEKEPTARSGVHGPGKVAEATDDLRKFVDARPGDLEDYLAPPAPKPDADEPDQSPAFVPLRMARPRAIRYTVLDRARLPAAGIVRQVVLARIKGKFRRLCASGAFRREPSVVRLHCRMSNLIRPYLSKRWIRVLVVTRFAPFGDEGKAQVRRRWAVVPRVPVARRQRVRPRRPGQRVKPQRPGQRQGARGRARARR